MIDKHCWSYAHVEALSALAHAICQSTWSTALSPNNHCKNTGKQIHIHGTNLISDSKHQFCIFSQHRIAFQTWVRVQSTLSFCPHNLPRINRDLLIHTGTFLAQLMSLSSQIHPVGLYLCLENKLPEVQGCWVGLSVTSRAYTKCTNTHSGNQKLFGRM